jgi:xylan 1,4-beta-xylosidase
MRRLQVLPMLICFFCVLVGTAAVVPEWVAAAEPLTVDASKSIGRIRRLHGVNNGPVNQGETVDVTAAWKPLSIPSTRLHDSEWPTGDIVDIHAIFPDLKADPLSPANYRFARTDDYIKPIIASGSGIVYRLGESIEHTKRKHFVHPPRDYDRWANVCLGIIRHYNEGWADGHRYQIRYWEIWNEPENRPTMWSGNDADYIRLYVTAAKAIKAQYPELKVGGPAAGASGDIINGQYQPTQFLRDLVKACRESQAPLDFFSWHTYTNDPTLYAKKAHGIRKWLDAEGFTKTESHLNEWNYLPGNDWNGMLNMAQPGVRDRWYAEMGGVPGATFVANSFVNFQDSPLDVANYYSGDTSPFGLFERFGTPKKTYYSFLAFAQLLQTPHRVRLTGGQSGNHFGLAGLNESQTELRVLVTRQIASEQSQQLMIEHLPWKGASEFQVLHLDEMHNLEVTSKASFEANDQSITVTLPGNGVVLIKFSQK